MVSTITEHAEALLRTARRYSYCADDAADAYQRALEIFLRHSATLDAEHAHKWLFTVVRNEAHAVREQRRRAIGREEVDFDQLEARHAASPEDRLLEFETVARSAEALRKLKPQEVRALWMKASGRSYAEIAAECGWTYTKVNRCLTEGRRRFLGHYAAIEAGAECEAWAPALTALVDGEATAEQLRMLRPHLRNCPACRADLKALHTGTAVLGAVFPVALVAGGVPRHGDGHGIFVRAHDFIAAHLHERVMTSALKVQATLDALSAGKVAAVAASAAAVAGGGLAVAEDAAPVRAHRAPATTTARAAPPPRPRTVRVKTTPPAAASVTHRASSHTAAHHRRRAREPARRQALTEFAAERAPVVTARVAAVKATRAPRPVARPAASAIREFGP